MKIAIIGAGISGISSAKVLGDLGHDCIVFEACPDVGGVWSATRRYPGLALQNTKDTFHFPDMPMPSHYPERPSGEQMLAYVQDYVVASGLQERIHLNAPVDGLAQDKKQNGVQWTVGSSKANLNVTVDCVVVCTGALSSPYIPSFEGSDEFVKSGGCIIHTSEIGSDASRLAGKDVVVLGYGRSACDAAYASACVAKTTTVIMLRRLWKIPHKIAGVLSYKWLLLTRFGESLFEYSRVSDVVERFFFRTRIGYAVRNGVLNSLEYIICRQLRFKELELMPKEPLETVVESTISLSTEGFYDNVAANKINVRPGTRIQKLCVAEGDAPRTAQLLPSGSVKADVVVCGTGFTQEFPSFLPVELRAKVLDENKDWCLYRNIKPLGDVEGLFFNGFSMAFFNTISPMACALWIGTYLARGDIMLPSRQEQTRVTKEKLAWVRKIARGRHLHGASVIPFSMHTIDEILADVGVNVGSWTRLKQWFVPVSPSSYRHLTVQLRKQLGIDAMQADKAISAD